MRSVLTSETLRTIERGWRSAEWLIQRLDDETAEIHVADLSREGLDLQLDENAEDLARSNIHRLLCEPDSGNAWDMVIGDYTFSMIAEDLVTLTTLGALAARARVPFLAHGDLSFCGCPSLAQVDSPRDWHLPEDELGALWAQVRSHPASRWVGLATPRFLLRQPYGPETDPVDSFHFSELPQNPNIEDFCWGNPAIGCALVMARSKEALSNPGEDLDLDIADLPTVVFDDGTGQALQPPVEALINDRVMQAIQASGLIPLLGSRNTNSIRIPSLVAVSSIATGFLP